MLVFDSIIIFLCAHLFFCPLVRAFLHSTQLPNTPNGLCTTLVSPYGTYSCQEFMVQTSDGFKLGVQKINSKSFQLEDKHPSVLLLHGLMQGGDVWELNLPDEALAFILADAGYEVWIGNFRSTSFSYGHVFFGRYSKGFWDWSVDELAAYDLPAILDLVHYSTSTTIDLIAYSQGTQATLAAFSQGLAIDKVNKIVFLAPIAYVTSAAPIVELAAKLDLYKILNVLRIYELSSRLPGGKQDVDIVCAVAGGPCFKDWVKLFTGYSCCINATRRSFIDKYESQGTSVKNLAHFTQQINSGRFSKFDYGFWRNLQRYGRPEPPAYDLSKIPTQKILLIHGSRDAYANEKDVARLLNELQEGYIVKSVIGFGHVDFVLGMNANRKVYDTVLKFLAS